jgi:group I intron endonuclease
MNKKDSQIFYVYAYLRNKDSLGGKKGTPYYIGKGKGKRAYKDSGRKGAPTPKDKSYIIFLEQGLTEQEALDLEVYYIALYGRIDIGTGILRNLTNGGDGSTGWTPSQETREKMSRAKVGKTLPQEIKDKMSQALLGNQRWLGKKHTQETKNKMAQARITRLYEFTDSDGEIYITDNAKDFARQYGLSDGHLNQVINGKRNHHKGWTGRIVETLR